MTPINFQKRYFFFLWPAYLDSCFNYAWSRSAKMLIPRLNFIDLKQPSIKIDTIADTASHSVIARKKGQPTTISSGHSNSQSVSLSLSALKPCLSDVLCAIDIEWMMRHISKQPAQSIQSMIHSHWNVYLRCVYSHFFFFSVFVAFLLACSQYKQHVSTDLLNRKSISIKRQRARNADTHKIPVCLSMNHNEHKISLHTAVKSLWIITCNLHTLDVCSKQSLCRFDELGVTF